MHTGAYLGVVPSFVVKPENKVALEGSTVVFACAANGRDREEQPPIISWLKDGITIDTRYARQQVLLKKCNSYQTIT